jgi:peptide deformylase
MALRKIVALPEPVLRRKARKVTDFGSDLQVIIDDMVDTMRDAPGVGLAATQIGESLRVIVVEFGDERNEETPPKLYAVVNPEIARSSEETVMGVEGCLSVPGFAGDVERSINVTIKGQNKQGHPIRIKAEGWLARIFQHEIDHINGILFIDRAQRVWQAEGADAQVISKDV